MCPFSDDDYWVYPLNFNFNYFCNSYSDIVLDNNGYIVFKSSTSCDTTGCPISRPTSGNIISALNYDLYTGCGTGCGTVQYKNALASDLTLIGNQISQHFASFSPTNAFIITYDNVVQCCNVNSLVSSFQIILSTDSVSSFVTIIYDTCLSGSGTPYYTGLDYIDQNQQFNQMIISNPCGSSNVGVTGLWIFYVKAKRYLSTLKFFYLCTLFKFFNLPFFPHLHNS